MLYWEPGSTVGGQVVWRQSVVTRKQELPCWMADEWMMNWQLVWSGDADSRLDPLKVSWSDVSCLTKHDTSFMLISKILLNLLPLSGRTCYSGCSYTNTSTFFPLTSTDFSAVADLDSPLLSSFNLDLAPLLSSLAAVPPFFSLFSSLLSATSVMQ